MISEDTLRDELTAMFLLSRFGKRGDWKQASKATRQRYREHAKLLREFIDKQAAYFCAGSACPGLPYKASERSHPPSCCEEKP